MAPPRRLPELIDGATEEILLRIAPEEPAHLVRASLVCKLWRRLLVDPAFVRRYREFHRTPPMLGFFQNQLAAADRVHAPWFVPTTSAPPLPQLAFEYSTGWEVLSSCHGRVLVGHGSIGMNLVVWDPVTRLRQRLPMPRMRLCFNYSYAVLCAVGSCNHLDCHGGPFLVVSVGSCPVVSAPATDRLARACVYSSETRAWGTPTSVDLGVSGNVNNKRSGAVVRDGIYFALTWGERILKFDLVKNCLSIIFTPDVYQCGVCSSLHLWSRKLDPKGSAGWVQCRVIDLEKLFPINNPRSQPRVIGFAEGLGVIFLWTDVGVFMMELKSGRKRKVGESRVIGTIIPFMSFYTPDCGSRKLPPHMQERN
ncbi:hypothetical protein SETIT_2G019600v2 [Setaria italica]|uniref:F-box domain-containing protein n=1 Tax=Setaria italica TaxID=4555 RepID=A0A368PUM7_SETIT|nr:hypothetical protein SETIT_2G019600v2 [Setaria italica]